MIVLKIMIPLYFLFYSHHNRTLQKNHHNKSHLCLKNTISFHPNPKILSSYEQPNHFAPVVVSQDLIFLPTLYYPLKLSLLTSLQLLSDKVVSIDFSAISFLSSSSYGNNFINLISSSEVMV
ncbi:hypothetical protein I3760_01G252100 [Carya illinoinensis]|nr:hypothetical protein I3760_01G252100 [Carya illinoinensis]